VAEERVSGKAAAVYKPFGLGASIASGVVAGAVFKQVWKRIGDNEPDAPKPTDRRRGWGEVLLAAAIHGAIFAVVKALVDRGGAEGFARLTGSWPGPE
jgi:hypothetical protein